MGTILIDVHRYQGFQRLKTKHAITVVAGFITIAMTDASILVAFFKFLQKEKP